MPTEKEKQPQKRERDIQRPPQHRMITRDDTRTRAPIRNPQSQIRNYPHHD